MLDGTMNRNDAHTFSTLGRNLERADMTSRIVDVRSAQLLPAETPELRPFETVQWMSVLKSLSGYQMYRLKMRTRVKRTDVLQFLLRDDQFPRSCQFCLTQLESSLTPLPRSEGVLEVLEGAAKFIQRAPLATLDQPGLHELIDDIQLRISNVHSRLAEIYFPSGEISGVQRMTGQSQSQGQSQRQTSLSFGARQGLKWGQTPFPSKKGPDLVPVRSREMKQKVVILSGSGLSAESGLPTFRDAAGLWREHSWQELASPEGWRKNPALVLEFYNERRAKAWNAVPNAGHLAIAALERHYDVIVVTQNVDALHERAGSTRVLHVHGELAFARGTGPFAPALSHRRRADQPRAALRRGHAIAPRHRVVWRRNPAHGSRARTRRRRRQGPGSWDVAQRLSRGLAGGCGARRCRQGAELAGNGRSAARASFSTRVRRRACCLASSKNGSARRRLASRHI